MMVYHGVRKTDREIEQKETKQEEIEQEKRYKEAVMLKKWIALLCVLCFSMGLIVAGFLK